MKVLEISLWPPSKRSGGGLVVYQSIKSFLGMAEVDYIGPDFDDELFLHNVKKLHILTQESTILSRILNLFFLDITTSFYNSWNEIKAQINWEEYDVVHIEASRYWFLVKEALNQEKTTLVRVHNIERDYALNCFKIHKTITNFLAIRKYKKNERKVLKNASGLIFLTRNDADRAKDFYGNITSSHKVVPACIDNIDIPEETSNLKQKERINVLLTGSLSYGPNEQGILWFLENVWEKIEDISDDFKAVVAGSNPTAELKSKIHNLKNADLIDSPDDMTPLFLDADIYVAPIFVGAGMKVKVAESLAHGVPVLGTSHAFIGYEQIWTGLYEANSEEEFLRLLLEETVKLSAERRTEIKKIFSNSLSINASGKLYKDFCLK